MTIFLSPFLFFPHGYVSELPLLTAICKALCLLTDVIQNSAKCGVYPALWELESPHADKLICVI